MAENKMTRLYNAPALVYEGYAIILFPSDVSLAKTVSRRFFAASHPYSSQMTFVSSTSSPFSSFDPSPLRSAWGRPDPVQPACETPLYWVG